MDKILEAVVMSSYPDSAKHRLVRRVVEAAKQPMDSDQCWSMLDFCTKIYLLEDSHFKREVAKEILEVHGYYHREEFLEFFNVRFILSLLQEGYGPLAKRNPYILDYIHLGLQFVLESPSVGDICSLLQIELLRIVCERTGPKRCAKISKLLTEYPQCTPAGKHTVLFCQQLIRCIGQFQGQTTSEGEMVEFLNHVSKVSSLLQKIWKLHISSVFPSLKELFIIISSTDRLLTPSSALASVVQYIPLELTDEIVRNLTNDDSITDPQMMTAICRMIDWVSWPLAKNIDKWIIALLKGLAAVKKFSILIEVTLLKIEKVFAKLLYSIVRERAFAVLRSMLLSFQHSAEAFHLLLPHIPRLVAALSHENSKSGDRCLGQLTELIHCMIFRFSGFPDLYEPVMDTIKALPVPNEDRIKQLLGQNGWTSQKSELGPFFPRLISKSDTGKIGLVNLGNTCYMNSVLQALFMAPDFRRSVLCLRESDSQPLMVKLQWLFAFLEHSQRPAISPESFLSSSLPPWFYPGAQQDCSEYLKYLLNRLHEEEKTGKRICQKLKQSNRRSPTKDHEDWNRTLIEKTFGGKIVTKIHCLKCQNVSSREESFTDLPLAFPPPDKNFNNSFSTRSSILPPEDIGAQSTQTIYKPQDQGNESPVTKPEHPKPGAYHTRTIPIETLGSQGSVEQGPFSSRHVDQDEDHFCIDTRKGQASACEEQTSGPGCTWSVSDLVNYYLSPEVLTADNKYHCAKCASLQDAEKVVELAEGPRYLILTLLRFSFDLKTMRRKKILDNVSIPLLLKLPILVGTREYYDTCHRGKSQPSSVNGYVSATYDLCTVIVHSGVSSESGHYYCYTRECTNSNSQAKPEGGALKSTSDKHLDLEVEWYLFNDTRVCFSSFESVCNVTSFFPKDTAYVLFYRQRLHEQSSRTHEASSDASWQPGEPSLSKVLMEAISKDNIKYMQEQEREARNRAAYISPLPVSPLWWRDFDDEDDDSSSGGFSPAAGGGGPGSFNRLVF
uniref:Ubiquitin carboxyl-terminal hydrolase 35 n=1 Tax=Geotrypetes seraphini TaxID=260995 RepID=A0A6P8RGT0_GEOSA|nr:ubiquitin carboxyl-terminal hydrolase 35 [Geotrypetes seraphini]XP_033803619.1 ubiquitin carboxyl-terminal hydrolase 35 [Geotrypetes seraphini]XP_033803620.1 ubiquitin carboxyl-terminal hydrolase 35 [Geotrypetes seraphini]